MFFRKRWPIKIAIDDRLGKKLIALSAFDVHDTNGLQFAVQT
ncbi:hypothetical protein [Persicobacter diffluens]|uniref:Uncharacterized protein n=1 Tax=Persicobacter diffluens TaxID=981 RepID=A0AAN5ALQ8_9BACT|nr:hypothetical protein PEDI_40710 [Persicobacter diffluens]